MRTSAFRLGPAVILLLALGSPAGQTAGPGTIPNPFKPAPSDVARIPGYPPIGKWMISKEMIYSDWTGATSKGKGLREPINVIIVDPLALSPDDAVARFLAACKRAGFASRPGHSGGHSGWLGGRLYPQIPSEAHHAISDEPFEFHNNHGRFFGPHFSNGRYFFIGAMSREKAAAEPKPEHLYISFNQARDRFAELLEEKEGFKITAFVPLNNAILDDPRLGTGDHDGVAVVLTATR